MKHLLQGSIFFIILLLLTSCEAIGDIFGAGFYTGIFVVVLVIGLIIFLVMKMGKKN